MIPVSAETMSEIDRLAREEYGISQEYLMERAGSAVASTILHDNQTQKFSDVLVLCGKGNNGGDGFVTARLLYPEFGNRLRLYIPEPGSIKVGSSLMNFNRTQSIGIIPKELSSGLRELSDISKDTLVVDALLGTGYHGAMVGEFGDIAEQVNSLGLRVYSVDLPSGLDATTGDVLGKCFLAFKTITFALPKCGFYRGRGPSVCGEITIADIGIPEKLVKKFQLTEDHSGS